MNIDTRLAVAALIIVLGCPNTVYGEQAQSLKAVISWSASGQVTQIGSDVTEFLGVLEGVMYVETAEGQLNEGFVECTAKHLLESERNVVLSGNCNIVVTGEDGVFAAYQCTGQPGACDGRFELTEGTGRFAGITGSSSMTLRSPLRHVAPGFSGGEKIRVDHGVMVLRDLSYSIEGDAR